MEELNPKDAALVAALRDKKGLKAVERALQAGANPKLIINGKPLVFTELEAERLETARLLLTYRADPDAFVHPAGMKPVPMVFFLTTLYGDARLKSLRLLHEFKADFGVLHKDRPLLTSAILCGGYKTALLCQEAGQDVDRHTETCLTALGMVTYSAVNCIQAPHMNWDAKAVYLVKNLGADRSKPAIDMDRPTDMAFAAGLITLSRWLDPATPLIEIPDYRTLIPGGIPGFPKKPRPRNIRRYH